MAKSARNYGPNVALPDNSPKVKPVDAPVTLEETLGSMTGETEESLQSGGWMGTDDATSTAPSDLPKHAQPNPHKSLGLQADPSGRASGGDLNAPDGGVSDITGSPVEGSQSWSDTPINEILAEDLNESD